MTDPNVWWKQEPANFLADALTQINRSRSKEDPVDRADSLFKALNKMWNAHFQYRRRRDQLTEVERSKGRSDSQAFAQLLLVGLNEGLAERLCDCESLAALAEFSPPLMNHDTLLKGGYDPVNITEKLKKEAIDEHGALLNAFRGYSSGPKDRTDRERLLKKLQQLLYVVRSNITHSEKTPNGPDPAKSERDRKACEVACAVVEDFFDLLLERPSQRLATYGTLAPGKSNHGILGGITGIWDDGTLRGDLTTEGGLPRFRWRTDGPVVAAKVLTSADLPEHFPNIDKFEGKGYVRKLIPVACGRSLLICNVYEAA